MSGAGMLIVLAGAVYGVLALIGLLQDQAQRDHRRRTGSRNPHSGPYGRGR